ncbi:hypothetical protein ACJMK2_032057 [Sinanodonta woodiana]|uniref:C-type lectin domain-containing protein n=1 Tax=Sinanodonta woodiana TaxID=1069815 RepID=A0ABD3X0J8_SINWO
MRITFIVLILLHQLFTCFAYGSVNMFLGSSFCQRIIQNDIEKAVKNVCTGASSADPNAATAAKLRAVEKKIDDSLVKLGNLRTVIAKPCTAGYENYELEGLCYKFYSECKTWTEAQQTCKDDGGNLISLTEGNFNFFRNVSQNKAGTCNHVWVGTTDINSVGNWNWLNGQAITAVFWSPGQPDNWDNKEHCGDLVKVSNYYLNDEDCSSKLHFICQKV